MSKITIFLKFSLILLKNKHPVAKFVIFWYDKYRMFENFITFFSLKPTAVRISALFFLLFFRLSLFKIFQKCAYPHYDTDNADNQKYGDLFGLAVKNIINSERSANKSAYKLSNKNRKITFIHKQYYITNLKKSERFRQTKR